MAWSEAARIAAAETRRRNKGLGASPKEKKAHKQFNSAMKLNFMRPINLKTFLERHRAVTSLSNTVSRALKK